ncbi:hypothetical protein AJ79_06371 [Helicocarpus griseus UAMH5409]|uniref:Non-haem dioxygenase N-terminal domain-containing protein n=1 Tax=Helicocarpus griseus UAMH5409 TaxID=1447875 RepID=A0A2B7XEB9_9EURO|nr:hypothetical protein AJ79_06371 [Helicocarpus griseus UAMH5409]
MLRPHCVLPDEIIERIVKQLDSIRDIYAFVQTSRHHYNLLRKYMYRHNIRYSSSSALLYAVDNGDEELVRQMIENKTGLSVLHENERIPERISARGGYPSTLSVMPKSASNTEAPWVVAYVSSPLAVAAGDGKALIVKMLLDSNHIRRDPLFRYETTEALTWVARHGHYEMVKMFLAYDVIDPNFPDRNGCPPLTHAVMGRHRDIVELLLADRRVNPDLHDLEGRTPLSYAAEAAYRKVSTAEPRNATSEEIPVIDISGIFGTLEERKQLAAAVKKAAEMYGFFHIRNHDIANNVISDALDSLSNRWRRKTWTSRISPCESIDTKEAFMFRYNPDFVPETKDLNNVPLAVQEQLKHESFYWEGTKHLPDLKRHVSNIGRNASL